MKQKVVFKISMNDEESRKKALKVAVSAQGVISAKLEEKDKGKMEVVGNDLDAVGLTNKLRKKFERSYCCIFNGSGYAELVSVSVVDEKKEEKKEKEEAKFWVVPPPVFMPVEQYPSPCSTCSIM